MRDDYHFNIQFVSLVKKQPCLYNYSCADYSKRDVQEKAWESIAEELKETVHECKERWKNIRGCYTRYLKSLTDQPDYKKPRKPYYLVKQLEFLRQFTKKRNYLQTERRPIYPEHPEETLDIKTEISVSDSEITQHSEFENVQDGLSDQDYMVEILPDTDSIMPPAKKMKTHSSINEEVAGDCEESKNKQCLNSFCERILEDADFSFLRSVLPDMKEMSQEQKRKFKIGVLNLATQILDENYVINKSVQ